VIFPEPRFSPLGDGAVTITLGDEMSQMMSDNVMAVAHAIESRMNRVEVVPSYAAVTVFFDHPSSKYAEIVTQLEKLVAGSAAVGAESPTSASKLVRIPVRYDGEDLDDVAGRANMTRESVIDLHSSREYRVYMLGFAPGFAYLGDLDERLALPRRDSPRKRVPAGSVAIAENQTAVYPSSTAGGWHLIGRTGATMFDIAREPPSLLAPGDRVRFERVDE
jgi:KipI family sensor histidine kinase inhibitor